MLLPPSGQSQECCWTRWQRCSTFWHCVGLHSQLSPSTHSDCPWAMGWTHLLPCIRFSSCRCHRDVRSDSQWCPNMKLGNHRHIMYTLCCVISKIHSYFSPFTNNCLYYFLYFSRYFLIVFVESTDLYRQSISPIRTGLFFFFFLHSSSGISLIPFQSHCPIWVKLTIDSQINNIQAYEPSHFLLILACPWT